MVVMLFLIRAIWKMGIGVIHIRGCEEKGKINNRC
jgi:hypothetical protein